MQMSAGDDFENGSNNQYSDDYQRFIWLIIILFKLLYLILLKFLNTHKMDTQQNTFKVGS